MKTHFGELPGEAPAGTLVETTEHGTPVARLVPVSLGGDITIRELIEEGRE